MVLTGPGQPPWARLYCVSFQNALKMGFGTEKMCRKLWVKAVFLPKAMLNPSAHAVIHASWWSPWGWISKLHGVGLQGVGETAIAPPPPLGRSVDATLHPSFLVVSRPVTTKKAHKTMVPKALHNFLPLPTTLPASPRVQRMPCQTVFFWTQLIRDRVYVPN